MTYMNMNFALVFSTFYAHGFLETHELMFLFGHFLYVCLCVSRLTQKKLSRDFERVRSCDGTGFCFFCFFFSLFSISLSSPPRSTVYKNLRSSISLYHTVNINSRQ